MNKFRKSKSVERVDPMAAYAHAQPLAFRPICAALRDRLRQVNRIASLPATSS